MNNLNKNFGFTLIELLVTISIATILSLGIYGLVSYSLRLAKEKGMRAEARTLANEKMEYFRSLEYDTLGVPSTVIVCDPTPCTIPASAQVVRNGINYTVLTDIRYIDDPFDNDGQLPEGDDSTGLNDYKQVRVEVQWPSTFDNNSVVLNSFFAPVGIETNCGGGIMKITVFDANAQPVPQASIYLENTNTSILYDTKTDNNGVFRMGCLPEDLSNNYKITINKPGATYYNNNYSTVQTCPTGTGTPNPTCPKTTSTSIPTDPHLNIIDGSTTEKSLSIDILSTVNIQTITENLPAEWSINKTAGNGDEQDMPTMDTGPSNTYYFFWRDDAPGPTRIFAQKYNSSQTPLWNGVNGFDDLQISTSNNQVWPNINVDQITGDVYLTWNHDVNGSGNEDIYIEKLLSASGSSVWSGENKLTPITTNSNDDQTNGQIDLEDDRIFLYLTFLDNSFDTANDIYTTRLNTADASSLYCNEDNTPCAIENDPCGTAGICTKWSGETKINNNDALGITQSKPITLIESLTDNLYIFWHDNRSSDNNIYGQKINPTGTLDATWANNIQINEVNTQDQTSPAVEISNESGINYLYITWQDNRNGNYDIYIAKYNIDGTRVWPNDININSTETTASNQTTPTITITSTNQIYIAWVDTRNGNQDIFVQKFDTNMTAQWTQDLMVNYDTNSSTQSSPILTINNSGTPVITWVDNNSGDGDIRAATFGDPAPASIGNVPLRIYGSKTIGKDSSDNNIYKFDSTFTTNASGLLNFNGTDQSKLEWDGYTIEINGTDYTILRSDPIMPININPNTTTNITLIVKEND